MKKIIFRIRCWFMPNEFKTGTWLVTEGTWINMSDMWKKKRNKWVLPEIYVEDTRV